MKKSGKVLITLLTLTLSMSTTAFAGTWNQDASGWWWQNDEGSVPKSSWQWIDGDGDGIAESYCFDENGYLYTNTTTPDGYMVNGDGAWIVDGVVMQSPVNPSEVPVSEQGANRALTDADRQTLVEALNKTNAQSSMAVTSTINVEMLPGNNTSSASMNMDLKLKDRNTDHMQYLITSKTKMPDGEIDSVMFYTNGYLYTELLGKKTKVPMSYMSDLSLTMPDLDFLQNLLVSDDGSGGKYYSYSMEPSLMSDYYNSSLKFTGTKVNVKTVSGTYYISPAGDCARQTMDLTVDITTGGQTDSATMTIDMNYINPGQPVDFVLPSTEGF